MIRLISLGLAIALSAFILLSPNTLALKSETPHYTLLATFLVGITIGFLHGTGFDPDKTWLKFLFGPITAWAILAGGLLYYSSKLGYI